MSVISNNSALMTSLLIRHFPGIFPSGPFRAEPLLLLLTSHLIKWMETVGSSLQGFKLERTSCFCLSQVSKRAVVTCRGCIGVHMPSPPQELCPPDIPCLGNRQEGTGGSAGASPPQKKSTGWGVRALGEVPLALPITPRHFWAHSWHSVISCGGTPPVTGRWGDKSPPPNSGDTSRP